MGFAERLRGGVRRLLADAESGEASADGASPIGAAPAVPLREVLGRFWPHARPYRRLLPPILVLVALGSAAEAATIWMYKVLVDGVLIPQNFGLLVWVLLAYVGLTLLRGLASFGDDYLSDWVGGRFVLSLRTELFAHLQRLSAAFLDNRRLGDVLSRLTDDVEEIEELLLSGMASAASYAFQFLFFAAALFYLDWRLALVSLFVAPLFWLSARYFSRKIKDAAREERRRSGSIGAVAEEGLSNAALVGAYNREEDEVARFREENEGSFRAQMAATRLGSLFSPLVDLIELLGVILVVAFGAYGLSQGRLTVGGLLVFVVYLGGLYRPIRGFSGLINSFYAASAGAERIIEFLDEEPVVEDAPWARGLRSARGVVEFDSVGFSYPGRGGGDKPALAGVSFRVWPGETLALVGESGSGKSTAAKLLLRFYDPSSGTVRLDGHDLKDLTLRSLRENVAVLLQETLIFDGTVRENIAYGKPDATEDEVQNAARAADAHGFIEGLPERYDTPVGQKGRSLSGGQRRRVAIARAMIRDAPVLVLDEPTAGLDAASAGKVMEPLRRLMDGRATVLISHDLATTREATEIAVLEDGRVAERGPHADLLEKGGPYARLYALHHPADAAARDAARAAGKTTVHP